MTFGQLKSSYFEECDGVLNSKLWIVEIWRYSNKRVISVVLTTKQPMGAMGETAETPTAPEGGVEGIGGLAVGGGLRTALFLLKKAVWEEGKS